MKPERKRNALPKDAVTFVRRLLTAGVKIQDYSYFVDRESEGTLMEFALLMGFMGRMIDNHSFYQFLPIALEWELRATKESSCDLVRIPKQGGISAASPSIQHNTTQLQPALASAIAAVFEAKETENGFKQLNYLTKFKMQGGYKQWPAFLRENRIALGIAHAMKIADVFSFNPRICINQITPIYGKKALGRSLFILIDCLVFSDFWDKVGTPTVGWWELRVVSKEHHKRLLVTFHPMLDILIPIGSLVAVGNIPFFKKA